MSSPRSYVMLAQHRSAMGFGWRASAWCDVVAKLLRRMVGWLPYDRTIGTCSPLELDDIVAETEARVCVLLSVDPTYRVV